MAFVREALLPFADGLERDGHDLVDDLAGDREAFRAAIAGLGTLTDIQGRLQTGFPRQWALFLNHCFERLVADAPRLHDCLWWLGAERRMKFRDSISLLSDDYESSGILRRRGIIPEDWLRLKLEELARLFPDWEAHFPDLGWIPEALRERLFQRLPPQTASRLRKVIDDAALLAAQEPHGERRRQHRWQLVRELVLHEHAFDLLRDFARSPEEFLNHEMRFLSPNEEVDDPAPAPIPATAASGGEDGPSPHRPIAAWMEPTIARALTTFEQHSLNVKAAALAIRRSLWRLTAQMPATEQERARAALGAYGLPDDLESRLQAGFPATFAEWAGDSVATFCFDDERVMQCLWLAGPGAVERIKAGWPEADPVPMLEGLRHKCFTFRDLPTLSSHNFSAFITKIDNWLLAQALAKSLPADREAFARRLPPRRADDLRELIRRVEPTTTHEACQASQRLVLAIFEDNLETSTEKPWHHTIHQRLDWFDLQFDLYEFCFENEKDHGTPEIMQLDDPFAFDLLHAGVIVPGGDDNPAAEDEAPAPAEGSNDASDAEIAELLAPIENEPAPHADNPDDGQIVDDLGERHDLLAAGEDEGAEGGQAPGEGEAAIAEWQIVGFQASGEDEPAKGCQAPGEVGAAIGPGQPGDLPAAEADEPQGADANPGNDAGAAGRDDPAPGADAGADAPWENRRDPAANAATGEQNAVKAFLTTMAQGVGDPHTPWEPPLKAFFYRSAIPGAAFPACEWRRAPQNQDELFSWQHPGAENLPAEQQPLVCDWRHGKIFCPTHRRWEAFAQTGELTVTCERGASFTRSVAPFLFPERQSLRKLPLNHGVLFRPDMFKQLHDDLCLPVNYAPDGRAVSTGNAVPDDAEGVGSAVFGYTIEADPFSGICQVIVHRWDMSGFQIPHGGASPSLPRHDEALIFHFKHSVDARHLRRPMGRYSSMPATFNVWANFHSHTPMRDLVPNNETRVKHLVE